MHAWHNPGMSDLPSSPLPIGADAPGFTLRRTFKESVSLDELLAKGPVAVVFYVFDFGDI
jgi:peroxiredoxin